MDSKTFLGKRRDRAIAILLSFKEREVDNYLPGKVSALLRREILDQINDLVDTAFDLLSADSSGSVINEEFLDRFNDLCDYLYSGEDDDGS